MSVPGTLRLVCFDLGGVVIRICRSWAEGCAAAGLPVRDPALWQRTRPARRRLIEQLQTGRIDGATFAARASDQVAGLYSPEEILGVHRAWLLDEYDGMVDLIDRVHDAGLDTAALSNTNDEHWGRLDTLPAVMRMRHRLASHQLGLLKPDERIYRHLEEQLGYRGDQIIFFDDTPTNVVAARNVGWHAHVIDPEDNPPQQVAAVLRDHGVDV